MKRNIYIFIRKLLYSGSIFFLVLSALSLLGWLVSDTHALREKYALIQEAEIFFGLVLLGLGGVIGLLINIYDKNAPSN
jgi:hypothetical protein